MSRQVYKYTNNRIQWTKLWCLIRSIEQTIANKLINVNQDFYNYFSTADAYQRFGLAYAPFSVLIPVVSRNVIFVDPFYIVCLMDQMIVKPNLDRLPCSLIN